MAAGKDLKSILTKLQYSDDAKVVQQITAQMKHWGKREEELRLLMDKAEQSAGGTVVNVLAFTVLNDGLGRDLTARALRVLHNLSFIEDPTRIFRGIRYEARFGFRLEGHSARLAQGCIEMGLVGALIDAPEVKRKSPVDPVWPAGGTTTTAPLSNWPAPSTEIS